jgi:hypothetical protein
MRRFLLTFISARPHSDPCALLRTLLSDLRGCHVDSAHGSFRLQVALNVLGDTSVESHDVRGAVNDTIKLRTTALTFTECRRAS